MKKKKKQSEDEVIVLTSKGLIDTVPASRFVGKMKDIYEEYDIDSILFQVGSTTPSYIPVTRKNALKKFEPFKIRYNLVVTNTSHNQLTRVKNVLYQDTKMAPMEVMVNTYPEFVSLLISINRLYLIALLTTKFETFNDINVDFEIYNKQLVVGSMVIEKGDQTIISPQDIHYKISDVIRFFAGALDVKEEKLLKHTSSRVFQSDSECSLCISLDEGRWEYVKESLFEAQLSDNDMISIAGIYTSGFVFLHEAEVDLLNILGDTHGEIKLCVYEQSGYNDFPELDRPITVGDITANPEEFYVDSLCINNLFNLGDIISAVSIIHEIAMSQSIILESVGITNAQFIIDIDIVCENLGICSTYSYYSEDLESDTSNDLVSEFIMQVADMHKWEFS